MIDVPKDVGTEEIDYIPVEPGDVKIPGYHPEIEIDAQQIEAAIALLREADKPLLYVGGGAIASAAHKEIQTLAEAFSAPMTNTLMGKGAVDEHHPLAVGMLECTARPMPTLPLVSAICSSPLVPDLMIA